MKWHPPSLRTRILALLTALVVVTLGGGIASILHGQMIKIFFETVMSTELPALQASQDLERTLVMQKGYVTYFFQDGDPGWLKPLRESQREFEEALDRCRKWAVAEKERSILNRIQSEYIHYSMARNKVIELYRAGQKTEGFALHQQARKRFFDITALSREFRKAQEQSIERARNTAIERTERLNRLAVAALILSVVISATLGFTLILQVLGPLRKLAAGSPAALPQDAEENEVKALTARFHQLVEDVNQTRGKLEWSREHLVQAEKWTMIGKLAAGVAHTVRNPLTSVKIRLFSLERTLDLDAQQKEDFEVISEEIAHIDGIVNNFLEFSRPPKPKLTMSGPSDAVDTAAQLLKHRLQSHNVSLEVVRNGRLPEIPADQDQLKEVLINLIVNACEAMVDGGNIRIEESIVGMGNQRRALEIRVSDDGPGIPADMRERVFQPFFSTKEEGTGLGLSIARRIVEEHGGWLELESGRAGTVFVITLPEGDPSRWDRSS